MSILKIKQKEINKRKINENNINYKKQIIDLEPCFLLYITLSSSD